MKVHVFNAPTVCLAFVLVFGALSSPVSAGVVTIGSVKRVHPPPSVVQSATEEGSIIAFAERGDVVLMDDLAVDITTSGTYGDDADLTPGVIAAGTRVSSFFMHFDPVTPQLVLLIPTPDIIDFYHCLVAENPPFDACTYPPIFPTNPPIELPEVGIEDSLTFHAFAAGSLVFTSDRPILGVMVTGSALYASDSILGLTGATYPTPDQPQAAPGSRGLELGPQSLAELQGEGLSGIQDIINISADRRSVTLAAASVFGVDQVRIIVGVPEPTTLALLCLAVIGPVGWRHRMR